MSTPEKCPKCGAVNLRFIDRNTSQFNCGSVSRNGTVVVQTALCTTNERDQLATKLADIESEYAECAKKMKRFRSRWLAAHKRMMEMENEAERASERVKRLEDAASFVAQYLETGPFSTDANEQRMERLSRAQILRGGIK